VAAKHMKFELKRLDDYSDDALLNEVRRVIKELGMDQVTRRDFDKVSKVSSSTLRKKFGSWQKVLVRAGFADLYSGKTVSDKMRQQASRKMSNEQLLAEIVRVADKLGTKFLSQSDFNQISTINSKAIISRFGSWKSALSKLGLMIPPLGRRYSEDDYFENLLAVWSHYGRQPSYSEMNLPPSQITNGAYEKKWGSWRKALLAFIEKVNSQPNLSKNPIVSKKEQKFKQSKTPSINVRSIPIGLRYNVLRRDRFRCVICGNSPAKSINCNLHVDHVIPISRDGKTEIDNLRTLCQDCNLGKSAKIENIAAT
jgi:hypothetical protein